MCSYEHTHTTTTTTITTNWFRCHVNIFPSSGTIRRFLEHFGEDIDLVVFVCDGQQPFYTKVLPLYFPRSAEEEAYAAKGLPSALGNEFGEPVIAERIIRITSNPVLPGGWSLVIHKVVSELLCCSVCFNWKFLMLDDDVVFRVKGKGI